MRRDTKRVITSGDAGFFLPIAHIPLLREDSIAQGRMRFNFVMGETADRLLNGVNVKVEAHFVPKLAFKRFRGLESFNRSWAKQPEDEDEPSSVIPFFNELTIDADAALYPPIFDKLGVHAEAGSTVNTDLIESYNALVNWQRGQRSKSLPQRDQLDDTIARCFWQNTQLAEVVPSFDSQQVHGDVPVSIQTGGRMNVQIDRTSDNANDHIGMAHKDGTHRIRSVDGSGYDAYATLGDATNMMFTELAADGISMSLSSFELARKTQAFAQLRNRYQSIPEEHLINMLMDGLRIPDLALREPFMLAQRSTLFGFSQRYASDFENLEKSMTTGETFVDLDYRMPATSTGGVVLFTASITPEQLYERQMDHSIHIVDQVEYPAAMVDELDPEKVEIKRNKEVDVAHTTDGVFGYKPLNADWMRDTPNIGGKFLRRDPAAPWDEDRARFWATETVDPELTEDFYLCTALPKGIFSDANVDSYEISAAGVTMVRGHTVFGSMLREATDDYEKIMEQVDMERIDQGATSEEDEVTEDTSSVSQQDESAPNEGETDPE